MPNTINADNGVVSGSSGLKSTADTSGVLALQSNGSTGLTLNTDLSVTFAGAQTLSGGTANGVTYLNGSKVLTSGSALTFDGTNLGLQSATNAYAGGRNGATFRANSGNGFEFILQSTNATAGTSTGFATAVAGNDVYFVNRLDGFYSWITGASGNSERMRLDSAGNLGLGVTPSAWGSPYKAMQVGYAALSNPTGTYDSLNLTANLRHDGTSWRFIETQQANRFSTLDGNWTWEYASGSSGNIASLSTQMVLDASGNLLVGTTSAGAKLDVSAANGTTPMIRSTNTTSGNSSGFASSLQTAANNTSSYHYYGSTLAVGNWYLYGNGTSSWSSDERLKKNITTTRDGYLEDVCKLRVVKYQWKNGPDQVELGLIAQEVEQVFPGLVQDDLNTISPDDPTIYKQLKGSVLPMILLKAIQEQQAIIQQLQADVATLKGN